MAAVSFTQVGGLWLYASSASGDAGVPGYWAGYRPSAKAVFGASVSLADTWADAGGTYLFLAHAPADDTAFSAALSSWLGAAAPVTPPRFLWLENPDDPAPYWRVVAWFARLAGSTWTTFGASSFVLGDYRVDVAPGAVLTLNQEEPAGAVIAAGAAQLTGPGGAFGPSGQTAIAFQGRAVGAWTGQISVPAGGLAPLGVELRYAVRNAVNPADPRLVPVPMPILGAAAAAMSLTISWDPLNPTLRGRTELRFAAQSPAVDAYFVTQRGYATTLTPASPAAPLWPGGLMFCRCATRIDATPDPRASLYSLAPDGAFTLAVTPPPGGAGPGLADELMLGLSGLESAALDPAGTLIVFDAGQPAFAPTAAPNATVPGEGTTLLTDLVTTAWVSIVPSAPGRPGLPYYAQPRQSPLFTGGGSAVMAFQEIPAARLPSYTGADASPPPSFPVGVYSGVGVDRVDAARALEQAALAPLRRRSITGPPPGLAGAAGDTEVLAISPQGLVVTLAPDFSAVSGVVIANLPDQPEPRLAFDRVGRDFEAALFANQLFFVVSNTTTFLAQASCVPPFSLDLDGWRFRLDPAEWRTGDAPTLMIWKYANRSLRALAADTASWGWQDAAKDGAGSLLPTFRTLEAILLRAERAAQEDPESPYARFYHEVVADPAWNGVLFLNAPVDLGDLPDALKFLSAGLEPARFYAHHVGVNLTPFDPSTVPITLKKTAVFGLIDYRDDVDLVPESTVPFAFKTMRLTARFANARLADFATMVELSLNQLFAAPLMKQDPTRGNNLLISGALQSTGGAPAYAFSLTGENRFDARNTALSSIEITSVRIETQSTPAPNLVAVSFALGGRLRFFEPPEFDPFGYGPTPAPAEGLPPIDGWLVFSQLAITLDFPLADPALQVWSVNETGIGFDLPNSRPRPASLVAAFPVTPAAIVSSPNLAAPGQPPSGLSPEDMGYLSISAPLDQTPMTPPWYGLVLNLDLGTLGALAGGAGLKAEILAAWSVGARADETPVYLGLKLPGTTPRAGSFPLQGVLKLGFKSFVFSTYPQNGQRAYLLRLSRFALSVLGLTFPPGNMDISLFAGPDGRSTGQLGWLAAYVDPKSQKSQGAAPAAAALPRSSRRKRLGRIPTRG